MDEEKITRIIQDTVLMAVQATKQENSGLIFELKKQNDEIKDHLTRQDEAIESAVKELHDHSIEDKKFQDSAVPMMQAFQNKKIIRAYINDEAKTITFYVKTIGVWALAISGVWTFVKLFISFFFANKL